MLGVFEGQLGGQYGWRGVWGGRKEVRGVMGQPHHVGLHEAIGWTLAFCEMGSFCIQCYYDQAHTFKKVSLVLAALSCRDCRGQSGKQGHQLRGGRFSLPDQRVVVPLGCRVEV